MIAHLMRFGAVRTGLAGRGGLFVGARRIAGGDCSDWQSGRRLLINPGVDVAIFEHSVRSMLDEGMAYDRAQVGVVTVIEPQALIPERHIDSPDLLWRVLRSQVDVVLRDGVAVLNADDPQTAALAELCDGEVIFFARDADGEVLMAHRAEGGRWVHSDGMHLLLMQGNQPVARMPWLKESIDPESSRGAGHPVFGRADALLAAVAAVWGAALAPSLIEAGLDTLFADSKSA